MLNRTADNAARATPEPLAKRIRGISDKGLAWLFISPTILLLLAINIFPLFWAIYLSFTNYRANRPNEVVSVTTGFPLGMSCMFRSPSRATLHGAGRAWEDGGQILPSSWKISVQSATRTSGSPCRPRRISYSGR